MLFFVVLVFGKVSAWDLIELDSMAIRQVCRVDAYGIDFAKDLSDTKAALETKNYVAF